MKALILMLATFLASTVSAEIYKYYDQEGKVVFSDMKNPAGQEERVELIPLPVMDTNNSSSIKVETPAKKFLSNSQPPEDIYHSLRIISPSEEASVRANTGNVTVVVATEPPLDVGLGDVIRLYLDGLPVAQGASLEIILDNLDRGEHSIFAEILNEEGDVLLKTAPQRFYLQRASVLFNKNSSK